MSKPCLFFIGLNLGIAIGNAMNGEYGRFYYWLAATFLMGIAGIAEIALNSKEKQ